ncbi:hypothetical protein [Mesorhizobium xinjiangense]|uniref:hypothetical protein n=1 Tax=Mesorhizobium xinjiangense TaxID=2678685 RepID=UPI0012EEC8BB|nr:hypothetical protein [Mesorhizobium xinjiangense]
MKAVEPITVSLSGTRALRLRAEAKAAGIAPERLADAMAEWWLSSGNLPVLAEQLKVRRRRRKPSVVMTPMRSALVYIIAIHCDIDGIARLKPKDFEPLIEGSRADAIAEALLKLEAAGLIQRHAPRETRVPAAWRMTEEGRQVASDLTGIGFFDPGGQG